MNNLQRLLVMLAVTVFLCLSLLGCGGAPTRTRPPGVPYPTTIRPKPQHVYPLPKVRCLGGGIGGCQHPMVERVLGGRP